MRLKEIGDIIKKYREQMNYDHYDLSNAIGKTKSYISRIENGNLETPPSVDTLNKISEVLNINEEDKKTILMLAAQERTPTIVLEKLMSLVNEIDELYSKDDEVAEMLKKILEKIEDDWLEEALKEALIKIKSRKN